MKRRRRRGLRPLALVLLGGALTCTTNAHAECRELGGIGLMIGMVAGAGTATVSAFAIPGIAMGISEGDLSYWPGFSYAYVSGATGSVAALLVTQVDCEDPVMWAPPINALGASVVSTIIWSATTSSDGDLVGRLSIAPAFDGDGGQLMVGGTF